VIVRDIQGDTMHRYKQFIFNHPAISRDMIRKAMLSGGPPLRHLIHIMRLWQAYHYGYIQKGVTMNAKRCLFITMWMIAAVMMPVTAHPPAQIEVAYDHNTQLLSINAIHPTKNVEEHHINQLIIEKDGKEILIQRISKQSGPSGQVLAYLITDVSSGDILTVTVTCNVFGKKRIDYTIPEK